MAPDVESRVLEYTRSPPPRARPLSWIALSCAVTADVSLLILRVWKPQSLWNAIAIILATILLWVVATVGGPLAWMRNRRGILENLTLALILLSWLLLINFRVKGL